jgi:flagellar motor switch protein FliG
VLAKRDRRLLRLERDDAVGGLGKGAGEGEALRGVDKDTLAMALKGASDAARQFFLGNMSTRAAKNLEDEMGGLGPVRLKEVDDAQQKMVMLTKDLAAKGEIMISKNRAEDELVY